MADYLSIDSNEKAQALFAKKELVKVYLMPLEFGGMDSPMNILFVPASVHEHKKTFDASIGKLLESGLSLGYAVDPEYKGSSFIPSKLTIQVTGDKIITETIEIW